jgi:transposase
MQVAMEATGVYWEPVWTILEDEFDCVFVNGRQVKQVPSQDRCFHVAWLCQLLEAGLLRRSLVPRKPIGRWATRRATARRRSANDTATSFTHRAW